MPTNAPLTFLDLMEWHMEVGDTELVSIGICPVVGTNGVNPRYSILGTAVLSKRWAEADR